MKPVPPIDSIYYEKMNLQENADGDPLREGCKIYLNTHDPENKSKFYRWEYTETWEFQLPYRSPNKICWISVNSDLINIKNTSALRKRVDRYPLKLYPIHQTDWHKDTVSCEPVLSEWGWISILGETAKYFWTSWGSLWYDSFICAK